MLVFDVNSIHVVVEDPSSAIPGRLGPLTKETLEKCLVTCHPDYHIGDVYIGKHVNISPNAFIDVTGGIDIGDLCMIGNRCVIYTHDHHHSGREPMLYQQAKKGIWWKRKKIGNDVWIFHGALILPQVETIPDGVVIGAGSVLTKQPGEYEIWAGNPARKIGER